MTFTAFPDSQRRTNSLLHSFSRNLKVFSIKIFTHHSICLRVCSMLYLKKSSRRLCCFVTTFVSNNNWCSIEHDPVSSYTSSSISAIVFSGCRRSNSTTTHFSCGCIDMQLSIYGLPMTAVSAFPNVLYVPRNHFLILLSFNVKFFLICLQFNSFKFFSITLISLKQQTKLKRIQKSNWKEFDVIGWKLRNQYLESNIKN